MKKGEKKRKQITKKLLHKYRLVILNEDTFEERFAIKLTRLNVFVIFSLSAIVLILLTTIFRALCPMGALENEHFSVYLPKRVW